MELFTKTIHILLTLKALNISLEIKTLIDSSVSLQGQPYQHNQAASALCSVGQSHISAQTPQTPHPGHALPIIGTFLVK